MIRSAAIAVPLSILARIFVVATVVLPVASSEATAASPLDKKTEAVVQGWFPDATHISENTGRLPHLRVYAGGDRPENLIGFAYFTTDIEKHEVGYKAPINFFVGMTVNGDIIGIKLADHDEPYGYFSIEREDFQLQFEGKSILDRFKIGDDIDAITSATITIASAARGIRNGGRRIARQFLAENRTDETR